jgi:hypothetical protein
LAGAVLGGLAGAVKITTFALFLGAFLFVLGLRCLHGLYRRQGLARLFHAALALGLLAVVPLLASYSWTRYADGVKERNPFGGDHLTSQNLQAWNFGAWTDRGDGQKWRAIHALARLGVSGYAAAACLAGLCLASAAALPARWRRRPPAPVPLAARWLAVAACLGVYLSGPLVFFNLYLIHDYYYFANTIFLVVAMGLGLVALIETGRAGQVVALALLLAALGGSLRRYSQHYFDLQTVNHAEILAICRQIQDHTRPDDVLVIIGHDWTPDLAYYSRRRALMLPFWRPESVETFCGKLAEIKDQSWGALLIDRAGESRFPQADILRAIEHSGFQARHLATQDLLELYTLHRAAPARSGLGPRSRLSLRESSVSFAERKTTLAARERLPQDLLELYGLKRAAPARVANGERR